MFLAAQLVSRAFYLKNNFEEASQGFCFELKTKWRQKVYNL